jgi:hypothetical protein
MNMTCSTLCLTFHTICMMRIRAKLRWWFIVPLGMPMSYACQSVGSESSGDVGSFLVNGHGAQVQGSRWIHFPFSGWGVGDRRWQPCPFLEIPHIRLGCRSLNCHMRMLADQYSVVSRPISYLALTLNHVYVWLLTILCMAILEHACST